MGDRVINEQAVVACETIQSPNLKGVKAEQSLPRLQNPDLSVSPVALRSPSSLVAELADLQDVVQRHTRQYSSGYLSLEIVYLRRLIVSLVAIASVGFST
jgi:hypothetical protein